MVGKIIAADKFTENLQVNRTALLKKMEKYGKTYLLHDNILGEKLKSALKMPASLISEEFCRSSDAGFLSK